jgi:hypothetical protein
MKLQPGDIVRIKGGQDEWEIRSSSGCETYVISNGVSRLFLGKDSLVLVRSKGPVVFECRWFSDGPGLPIYPMGIGEDVPVMQQFLKKRTRVTVEVIEEGK